MSGDTDTVGKDGLIFHWQKSVLPRWKLAFFLLFAAVAHIAFFYLFRVVYPEPVRAIPSPNRITVLSHADPSARAVLEQLADFRSAYFPSSGRSVDLTDYAARFVPSFLDFKLDLKVPNEGGNNPVLPPLSIPGELTFPPLAVVNPNAVAGQPEVREVKLKIVSGLAGREIRRLPQWDIERLAGLHERNFLFSAGFDHLGMPVYLLPLQSPGNPEAPETATALLRALRELRLAPGQNSVSGTLEVSW